MNLYAFSQLALLIQVTPNRRACLEKDVDAEKIVEAPSAMDPSSAALEDASGGGGDVGGCHGGARVAAHSSPAAADATSGAPPRGHGENNGFHDGPMYR